MTIKKLTEEFKFRYIDTELTKEEIDSLSKEQWKALYFYMVKRDAPFKESPVSALKTILGIKSRTKKESKR